MVCGNCLPAPEKLPGPVRTISIPTMWAVDSPGAARKPIICGRKAAFAVHEIAGDDPRLDDLSAVVDIIEEGVERAGRVAGFRDRALTILKQRMPAGTMSNGMRRSGSPPLSVDSECNADFSEDGLRLLAPAA